MAEEIPKKASGGLYLDVYSNCRGRRSRSGIDLVNLIYYPAEEVAATLWTQSASFPTTLSLGREQFRPIGQPHDQT